MSQVLTLSIVFSGNLREIAVYLGNNGYAGVSIAVPSASVLEFQSAGNRRDTLDISDISGLNVFPIAGVYSYGFDIYDHYGYSKELETNSEDTAIYHLVNGFAGEPRYPGLAEKVEVLPSEVIKMTSDELFKVVATYDIIHDEAKKELNKRIAEVQQKL